MSALVAGSIGLCGATALSESIVKDNNTTTLDSGASWVGGIAPGSLDLAVWDATVTAAQTVSLGSNLQWQGMSVLSTLGGNLTFNTGNTLTLGSSGFSNASGKTITLNNAVALGTAQTWNSTGGIVIFAGGVNTAGNQLTVNGSGTLQFKGAITGAGDLVVNHSNLKFSNGTNASASAVTINAGGTLVFDSSVSSGGAARMASLTIGGTLNVAAASNANEFDQITGALTAKGAGKVIVTANASRYAQLEAGSFVRNPGAVMLFTGTNLGVNTLASQTTGAANILFDTAPALVGGGGLAGSTTVSLLPGAYGDTTSGSTGFGATGGLVTYDASNGIRLLTSPEYATAITDGQTQLDNVKLSGVTGTPLTVSLASANTTINSLSISVTGAGGNSGVTLAGAPATKLTVSSGIIYGSQSVTTAASTDTMLISVPTLDLNGREGVVLVSANGSLVAPLQIDSVITNDGGNGLTKGGSGTLKLGGAVQNTYSGDTVVTAGILYLGKTAANTALPEFTTLVVDGGQVLQDNNQIPDSVNVVVKSGSWIVSSSGSNGNISTETINNLTVSGGTAKNGQSKGGTLNILGNANLTGGTFSAIGSGSNVTISGLLSVSNGATATLGGSSTTGTTYNSKMTLNGGLAITNTAAGAYTPLTISAAGTAGNNGGRLVLASDLTFTGNATNSNTTTIGAPTGVGNSGVIALNGLRTFNVGDGAAASDLTVVPALTDNATTVGGLSKSGAGTLELTGSSTYTGTTNIDAGALVLTGSLSGTASVAVNSGGTLILNGNDRVNDAAAVILSGGKLSTSGFSEGSLSSTPGLGALTLTANSVIDFGSGTGSSLLFAGLGTHSVGTALAIANWSGTASQAGGLSDDRLLFAGTTANFVALYPNQADVSFNGIAGYSAIQVDPGYYEIVAVPEPSTFAFGLAAVGFAGWRRRRSATHPVQVNAAK